MAILEWLERLWRREAVHFVYERIPPERQDPAVAVQAIQPEVNYFRVWLTEMFLRDARKFVSEFEPVVHSVVKLQFGTGNTKSTPELPYVAGPQNLGLSSDLASGIQLNHPLTNALPFRGGVVSIAAALVAYKRKDFLKGLIEVVNGVSGLLNVGQLSTTLKVVESAVDGVQSLFGAGDKDIHLLYYEGFAGGGGGGNPLQSGFLAIVAADEKKLDRRKLYVKERRLHFGNDLASAKPLTGYDYMLLSIEATTERDDYRSFEDLGSLLNQAIAKALEGDAPGGTALLRAARIAALTSADLTREDRFRVAEALKNEYDRAVAAGGDERVKELAERMTLLDSAAKQVDPRAAAQLLDKHAAAGAFDFDAYLAQ